MFGKNRISFNIIMDIVMLITMVLVSISGFILKVVIPSRHAVRFQDATSWCAHLLGLGRHDWGNIHLWAGIVLVSLVTIHVLLPPGPCLPSGIRTCSTCLFPRLEMRRRSTGCWRSIWMRTDVRRTRRVSGMGTIGELTGGS